VAWHDAVLARIDGQALERIGLHGLTGEPEPQVSDEDHAEAELQKLRMFKSRMKAMGISGPPQPAN